MSPQLMELVSILNEMVNMSHVQDWKTFSSFAVFLTSFITGIFLWYDNFRAKDKQKLSKSPFRLAINGAGAVFFSLAVYAMVRTLDSIQDMIFLLANPRIETTLSQRSLILEIPFIGVAITIAIFLFIYIRAYLKLDPNRAYPK